MGIIKAFRGAVGSVLEEQWKEFFCCDAMNDGTILVRAEKRVGKNSANTRKDDNVLTNGSVLCVAEGQCVLVVKQGKVIDFCAEPGEHIFEDPEQRGISGFMKEVGRRVSFGGGDIQPVVYRVYYMNVKEIFGNPFRTETPIPLRIGDSVSGLDLDSSLSVSGVYSYRVSDPVKLYKTIIGNVRGRFTREDIASHMDAELIKALAPSVAKLSESGIRPSAVPGHCSELCEVLRERMNEGWCGQHGLELGTIAINGFQVADSGMVQSAQYTSTLKDPTFAGAVLTAAAAEAMPAAARSGRAAAMPFIAAAAAPAQPASAPHKESLRRSAPAETWRCSCGAVSDRKFCPECGKPRPVEWTCSCGQKNKGRFCENCGQKRPD